MALQYYLLKICISGFCHETKQQCVVSRSPGLTLALLLLSRRSLQMTLDIRPQLSPTPLFNPSAHSALLLGGCLYLQGTVWGAMEDTVLYKLSSLSQTYETDKKGESNLHSPGLQDKSPFVFQRAAGNSEIHKRGNP